VRRLLWAVLLTTACATSSQKTQQLKTSVDAYLEALRWKYYERAAAFRPNDLRASFLAAMEDEGTGLQIEDIQVLRVDVQSEESADITVRIRYMRLPSVTVQTDVVRQAWHRVDGKWILEFEEPPFIEIDPNRVPPPKTEDDFGGEDPGDTDIEVSTPWDDEEG